MSITLTPKAAERIRNHITRRGAGLGLRVGLRKTGCSGWSYTVDYADECAPGDVTFEDQGITVVMNRDFLKLLDGTQIDYVREGLNERFEFDNPNVGDKCGCGESFTLEED
ncbi:MAG: iron-sulfur cluster assembly accessory protein [Chromatiales bacterium]|nr:iron-sulfur cluster assembly accessory protein [Chromatiales bacterium]